MEYSCALYIVNAVPALVLRCRRTLHLHFSFPELKEKRRYPVRKFFAAACAALVASAAVVAPALAADKAAMPKAAPAMYQEERRPSAFPLWWLGGAHLAFPQSSTTTIFGTKTFTVTKFVPKKVFTGYKWVKVKHKWVKTPQYKVVKKPVTVEKTKTTRHTEKKSGKTEAALTAIACTLGAGIASLSDERERDANVGLWSIGCFLGGFVNPGAAVLGGSAALALFSPQGAVTKALRPGGFRCQEQDRGRVAGCTEWLNARPTHVAGN
jgi:hypothetical protein